MFFDAVIQQKPIDRYRILEKKLEAMGRDITAFKSKSAPILEQTINVLEGKIQSKRFETGFMEFMENEDYIKDLYTRDALSCLLEYKNDRDSSVVLIPGMTYYSVARSGNMVTGKKCHYLSEDRAFWTNINEDTRKLKAYEVMQWGNDNQFRKIYFELADGRLFESAENFILEHISESSDEALDAINEYCDTLWEGKWPWELSAPLKLRNAIQENTIMTKKSVQEFREAFTSVVTRLNEGEIERSAVITKMQGYIEDIDNMLEKLGRVSGNLLTDVRESVRAEFGEDAANRIANLVEENIKGAADNLSNLKGAWSQELDTLVNGGGENESPEFDADPEADAMPDLSDDPENFDDEAPADDMEPDMDDMDIDLGDDEEDLERDKK